MTYKHQALDILPHLTKEELEHWFEEAKILLENFIKKILNVPKKIFILIKNKYKIRLVREKKSCNTNRLLRKR